MGARTKEIAVLPLGDLDLAGIAVGGMASTTRLTGSRVPAARGATRVVREPAPVAAKVVVDFLAERRIIA